MPAESSQTRGCADRSWPVAQCLPIRRLHARIALFDWGDELQRCAGQGLVTGAKGVKGHALSEHKRVTRGPSVRLVT